MEGFTIIDGVVAIVIVISALLAYSRGFVREVLAIAGWIGATILAFIFADQAQPLVAQIPVLGDMIGDSCELAIIASFAAVFAVALIVFAIFTPLFSGVVQRSALGRVHAQACSTVPAACAVPAVLWDPILELLVPGGSAKRAGLGWGTVEGAGS